MPMARQYEYYEVRDMLKAAENANSPSSNQHGHGRGLHAMSRDALGTNDQLDRVTKRIGESNNQFKNRGGATKTGAFLNQIQQGSAACEALNSPTGQAALAIFDAPAHAGIGLRLSLDVAGVKEAGFVAGSLAPHATQVKKGDMVVQTLATTGVKLIVDRGAGATSFHIQTCYPLTDPFVSNWEIKNFATNVQVAAG